MPTLLNPVDKSIKNGTVGIAHLNPVDKSIKNGRVGIAHQILVGNAHPTIAQLVFKDRFQPHSV